MGRKVGKGIERRVGDRKEGGGWHEKKVVE